MKSVGLLGEVEGEEGGNLDLKRLVEVSVIDGCITIYHTITNQLLLQIDIQFNT